MTLKQESLIDYLMNNTITPNAMSASLMNLIYKKNVSVEKLPEQKNNYKFTLAFFLIPTLCKLNTYLILI